MVPDIGKNAKELLGSEAGAKLAGKQTELQRLADSKDGQRVRSMLENGGTDLAGAFQRGDTAALQAALRQVLLTEEGGRVVKELSKMME